MISRNEKDVDLIIFIGPDNPGEQLVASLAQSLTAKCEASNISYKIFGNGGSDTIDTALWENMPSTKHVAMLGHGRIATDQYNETVHAINLSGADESTPEFISQLQEATGAEKILVGACYSGFMNQYIKETPQFLRDDTEIISTSSPDKPSAIVNSFAVIEQFIVEIGKANHETVSMTDVYAAAVTKVPDVLGYAAQQGDTSNTFITRREERAELSDTAAEKWVQYNLDRFHQFTTAAELQKPSITAPAESDVAQFRINSLFNHVLHADNDVVKKILADDPNIINDYAAEKGAHLFEYVLQGFNNFRSASKSEVKFNELLEILNEKNPDGLVRYMLLNFDHEPQAQQDTILKSFLELANRTNNKELLQKLELANTVSPERLHKIAVDNGLAFVAAATATAPIPPQSPVSSAVAEMRLQIDANDAALKNQLTSCVILMKKHANAMVAKGDATLLPDVNNAKDKIFAGLAHYPEDKKNKIMGALDKVVDLYSDQFRKEQASRQNQRSQMASHAIPETTVVKSSTAKSADENDARNNNNEQAPAPRRLGH